MFYFAGVWPIEIGLKIQIKNLKKKRPPFLFGSRWPHDLINVHRGSVEVRRFFAIRAVGHGVVLAFAIATAKTANPDRARDLGAEDDSSAILAFPAVVILHVVLHVAGFALLRFRFFLWRGLHVDDLAVEDKELIHPVAWPETRNLFLYGFVVLVGAVDVAETPVVSRFVLESKPDEKLHGSPSLKELLPSHYDLTWFQTNIT